MAVYNIDENKCTGCRTCVKSCPMDVLAFKTETKKAVVKYPKECVMCCICIADCPTGAIEAVPGQDWMTSGY